MKKRILSLVLAVIMVLGIVPVTYAANYMDKTVSDDITILSGDDINDNSVFTGKVTIAKGATVNKGTFKGAVTVATGGYITGGTFTGPVTVEKGSVNVIKVESPAVYGGTFKGTVTANGIINGGTFDGTVNANNAISSGTFNGTVNVAATASVTGGSYYGPVNNSGNVRGGIYYNIINNSGSVGSLVSALIHDTATDKTTVQNAVFIKSNVTVNGEEFTLPKNASLTVDEDGKLTVNCTTNIAGTLYVNGDYVQNGGKGTELSGKILIYDGASASGRKLNDFQYITQKQYTVKVQSNVDLSEFDITLNTLYKNVYELKLFEGATLSYFVDFSATNKGCITVNSVALYKGRKADSNLTESKTSTSGSFTMPAGDAILYVDCTANHAYVETAATCTTDGFKRCERCNHVVKTADAPGHQFGAWVRNTDSSQKYLKSRTCTRSGCNHTEYAYIEIKGYDNQAVTVDYKSTLTFNFNVAAPEGCTVQWKVNNGTPTTATESSKSCTVTQATGDFTVTAIVYGSGTLRDEYTVKVTVKHGFFDKFIAFFRGLFKALPVYVDGVKQ